MESEPAYRVTAICSPPDGDRGVRGSPDTIAVPAYRARSMAAHLKRITERACCDPSDTRTANALRLAKADLRTLEKLLGYDRR